MEREVLPSAAKKPENKDSGCFVSHDDSCDYLNGDSIDGGNSTDNDDQLIIDEDAESPRTPVNEKQDPACCDLVDAISDLDVSQSVDVVSEQPGEERVGTGKNVVSAH